MDTLQYISAVLQAYEIVPMEDSLISSPCSSSVPLKRDRIALQIDHFALPQREETTKNKSGEEDSMNVEETQIPFTIEQPSHRCATVKTRPKLTRNDVLKAHGIL